MPMTAAGSKAPAPPFDLANAHADHAAGAAARTGSETAGPVAALTAVGLTYAGGIAALHGIDLTLAPGSFTFVTGASGAGKTSLLNLIGLAVPPSTGNLRLFGSDVAGLDRPKRAALRRQIGRVFQDVRLLDHLSTLENVMLPLQIVGVSSARCRADAVELLGWVGLGDRVDCRPASLTGDQRQRVAIARAVIARPQLLLADEPTGNVDADTGRRLLELIEALHREGTTVLVATHNRGLVQELGHPEFRLPVTASAAATPAAGAALPAGLPLRN
jgi:cell division transport system ATP-binding protein